jgi:hypothetical protein
MYRIMGSYEASEGVVDVSLRDPSPWHGPPGFAGFDMTVALVGDDTSGPFLALAAVEPRTEPMPRTPAHGHDCDSWRIAINGTLSMGSRRYGPGEFRFQEGGKPYGADDYAWGPDGGQSVVMMSDRRGPSGRPVNPKYDPYMRETGRGFYAWLGIDVPDVYPGAPGVVSSLGQPDKGGALEGSFARSAEWPLLAPGVRGFVALAGDHEAGPVILTLAGESAADVLPSSVFGTEVVLLVIRGSAQVGTSTLDAAQMRIVESGHTIEPVVAGPAGLGLVAIVGDRRRASQDSHGWLGGLGSLVDSLRSQLEPQPAGRGVSR